MEIWKPIKDFEGYYEVSNLGRICVELGIELPSAKIAGEELNLCSGNITRCCQGKYKSCGSYHFIM